MWRRRWKWEKQNELKKLIKVQKITISFSFYIIFDDIYIKFDYTEFDPVFTYTRNSNASLHKYLVLQNINKKKKNRYVHVKHVIKKSNEMMEQIRRNV